ncbi:MAG: hypothetical protein U0641_03210 [Anaerolineae bacterium]
MKVLAIVPYVPNLVRVRPYQPLRGVARRGHHTTLATLWDAGEDPGRLCGAAGRHDADWG